MEIAIYSRKSKFSETGDSIENQIQLCKEHVGSHVEGNHNFYIYEDEGFSGGNTNRPEFQRLLEDIKNKKIEILICYRLDRISRNVLDFSSTLDVLQRYNVAFISIKEQFDTSTPMGRAMIYIASVFAQLERETIAERVRDNMLELAKSGRWLGGTTPIGYTSTPVIYVDKNMNQKTMVKLKQAPKELETVKIIYSKYIELGSLAKVETFLMQNNYRSKKGGLLNKSSLRFILSNTVYVKATQDVVDYLNGLGIITCGEPDGMHGMLTYNKTKGMTDDDGNAIKIPRSKDEWISTISSQQGIIDADEWLEAQSILEKNRELMQMPKLGKTHNALLTKVLKCAKCGAPMQINHGHVSAKTGQVIYYYSCTLKKRSKGCLCSSKNIKVADLDASILSYIKEFGADKTRTLTNYINQNSTKQKELSKLDKSSELSKTIQSKKNQIDNLITKISHMDEDISDLFLQKIKDLQVEIQEHQKELSKIEDDKKCIVNNDIELSYLEVLLNQCSVIDELNFEQQQELVSNLFPLITWDEDTDQVDLTPFYEASKKKLSKVALNKKTSYFGITSSCS
ncbi:MAG: recombinase family protein [Cellulosilyticaceae bacterium]